MSAVLDAAVVKVKAGRSPAPRVFKMGAVPVKPVYPYSVVGATSDQALNYTNDAVHGTRDYRLWVQSFGNDVVAADQAGAYDDAATAALLDQRLTVAGLDCGPIRHQVSSTDRDPDDNGVVTVTSAFIFTTTKEQP